MTLGQFAPTRHRKARDDAGIIHWVKAANRAYREIPCGIELTLFEARYVEYHEQVTCLGCIAEMEGLA